MTAPADVRDERPDDRDAGTLHAGAADGSTAAAPARSPWPARFAAFGGGALVAFSLPPWGFWPLAVVGVAVFEIALGDDRSRRERTLLGWLFGAAWMFLGMGWMVQLTVPGYLAAGIIFAGFHAGAAAVAPTGPWRIVGRPVAHTLVEALRFSFPFGGVPLASLGISQVAGPFAGVARVGGVVLLTWLVFQLGIAIGAAVVGALPGRVRPDQRGRTHTAAGVLAVAAVVGLAAVAPAGSPNGDSVRVAAVQGGGEQGTSALDVPSEVVTDRHLEATATIDAADDDAGRIDFVFWPENTIDVASFDGSPVYDLVVAEARRLDAPLAVGVTEDARERRFTNAHVVVAPDGRIVSRYDKVRRVPFGEYVPLRGLVELFSARVDRIGEAVAGTEPAVLDVPVAALDRDVRFATVISWEVFFGGRAREGVERGAEAILNPTNGASYTGTIVQTQQVASSRLRAIETGRWVVQAAPTGFTAVIDDTGRVVERTSQREQYVLVADVELRTGDTWYVRVGDGPWIAALFLMLGLAIWRSRPSLPRPFRRMMSSGPS